MACHDADPTVGQGQGVLPFRPIASRCRGNLPVIHRLNAETASWPYAAYFPTNG